MKRTYQPSKIKRARKHGFRSKMKTKGEKTFSSKKSQRQKISTVSGQMNEKQNFALSKNEEFKALIQGNKLSNKYVTVFFKIIKNKNKKLNIGL